MPQTPYDSPRLLADIGGTYARFTLEIAPGVMEHLHSLQCQDHADFYSAVKAYLGLLPAHLASVVRNAAVAIATPIAGDQVRMTNYHWEFSIEQMRVQLGFDNLVVVNDFTALAMALPSLLPHQRRQVGQGTAENRSVVGLIGAGSGLGVSGLIPAHGGWIALGTEGGHTSFAPLDEREIDILRYAWTEHAHVSFERLVSGPGLELIHRALAHRQGEPSKGLAAAEITHLALQDNDKRCLETLDVFCAILGTAAANLAVTQGAFGGIYIGGGIVPRLGDYFDRSRFRERFEYKGRFSDYLKRIPTFVVTSADATLVGASMILSSQLRALDAAEGSALLGQIQRVRASLSPAEQRVADQVLAHPRSTVNDPIATIARAANVSQPTVIRFCRTLGCEGLSDFKMRLASGLTGTIPIVHTQVTSHDGMLELGAKVLGNTAAAVLQVRDHLNRDSIDKAIKLISNAERVEFYAVGHYAVVAEDAQLKFMRLGMPSSAYTAPRMQLLASNLLNPKTVVVVISSSGKIHELLEVVERARAHGSVVIAITAGQSPLARKADLTLIVDHVEDINTQVPMVSRILHLLMIDILVVGVSMRRGVASLPMLGSDDSAALEEDRPGTKAARRAGLGISAAGDLTQITSHAQ